MTTASTHPNRGRRAERKSPPVSDDIEALPEAHAAATASFIEPGRRRALISEAAYFRAVRRGLCPGQELDDWLAAEKEIDRVLNTGGAGS